MSLYRNLTEKYYLMATGATSISAPIYEGFSLSFLIVSRKSSAAAFTVTFQQSPADASNPCVTSGVWTDIPTVVECDDPAGTTSVAAAVTVAALPAYAIMQAEVPCVVGPFVRAVVTGTDLATVEVIARIGHLRRWQNP